MTATVIFPASLTALFAQARAAGPLDRIELRDPIARYKLLAIEPMVVWLGNSQLANFAFRVLGKIAAGNADEVFEALEREGGSTVAMSSARYDVEAWLDAMRAARRRAAGS